MFGDLSTSVDLVNANGECASFSPEELMSRKLNSWKGWYCSAGSENIYVNHDGNVYVGACKVGGVMGNVYDYSLDVAQEWIECDEEWCMCGQDMQLRKARTKELVPRSFPPFKKIANKEIREYDWVLPNQFDGFSRFPRSVTWDLGRRCNYSCHYCHPSISNTYESHKSWGSLKHAADNIIKNFARGKKVKWIFTGGEPTINPNFMELIKYLHEKWHNLHTQTNASRRADYYSELIEYSSIGISLHLEYYREEKFLGVCRAIREKMADHKGAAKHWFEIRIMVAPNTIETALGIREKILTLPGFENFQNIHFSPLYKTGLEETADRMVEYDGDEYERIIAHC